MNNIIKGQAPSEEEIFYKKWGWDTFKENIATLNEVLKLFITLDIAIVSLYLGINTDLKIPYTINVIVFILLILSLFVALIGVYPWPKNVNINMPEQTKSYKIKRSKLKSKCLFFSFLLLITVFIVVFWAKIP